MCGNVFGSLCGLLNTPIPDAVARVLGSGPEEREQRARESIALELYREGRISLRAMGRLAGVGDDYWAADAFRVRYGVPVVSGDTDDGESEFEGIDRLLQE